MNVFTCIGKVLHPQRTAIGYGKKEFGAMQTARKALDVTVRSCKFAQKFQADIKVSDRSGIDEIAEQWAESASFKPVMAKSVLGSHEVTVV